MEQLFQELLDEGLEIIPGYSDDEDEASDGGSSSFFRLCSRLMSSTVSISFSSFNISSNVASFLI